MPIGIPKSGRRTVQNRVEHVIITCEVCGKQRDYMPSQLRVRKRIRFCSITCRNQAQVKPGWKVEVSCAQCGTLFQKRSDHLHERNYCSPPCSALGRSSPTARWRDPAQIREYMHEYAAEHREEINAFSRRWGAANRSKKLANQRARRVAAKKDGLTAEHWEAIKSAFGFTCLACGKQEPLIKLTADHVIPVRLGGRHHHSNIQPLCGPCNAAKGMRFIDYRFSIREV